MRTNASHILAAMFEGPITTSYVVVKASGLSPTPTNAQLDSAFKNLRAALIWIEAQKLYEARDSLNRAYAALGATNPLPDVISLRLGYHPLLLARAGKLLGGDLFK